MTNPTAFAEQLYTKYCDCKARQFGLARRMIVLNDTLRLQTQFGQPVSYTLAHTVNQLGAEYAYEQRRAATYKQLFDEAQQSMHAACVQLAIARVINKRPRRSNP